MSYLVYLCLLSYGGVQHILCCVFICFSSSCVPYVVPVSQDCPFNLFCPFVVPVLFIISIVVNGFRAIVSHH